MHECVEGDHKKKLWARARERNDNFRVLVVWLETRLECIINIFLRIIFHPKKVFMMISPHVCELVPHLVYVYMSIYQWIFFIAYRHDQTPNTIKVDFHSVYWYTLYIATSKRNSGWKFSLKRERARLKTSICSPFPLTIIFMCYVHSRDKEINITIYPSAFSISLICRFHSSVLFLFFNVAALKIFYFFAYYFALMYCRVFHFFFFVCECGEDD